jgi:hypothetical protein
MKTVMESLEWTIKEFSQIFLILDAVEQCPNTCQKDFFRQVTKLQARFGVKIFITSVSVPEAIVKFADTLTLQMGAGVADLERYIKGALVQHPSIMQHEADIRQELISTVLEKANERLVIHQILWD